MARPGPCQNSGKVLMPDNTAKAVDSMGKVTEELVTLITKQIQDHGIVVWYDPEQAYGDVVDQLHLPETTVLRYQGSFFALRHRLEPFLEFVDDDGSGSTDRHPAPGAALRAT